jgi:hypothetical protein
LQLRVYLLLLQIATTPLAVALHQYVQRHVEDYSKSCTASVAWLNCPNFDWQVWENDSQALVAASFWTCKTERTSFPPHEMLKKKRAPWNCHE